MPCIVLFLTWHRMRVKVLTMVKFGHGTTHTPEAANDVDHCQDFIDLHVISKNLQSIRSENKFQHSIAELDTCDFDILLVSESRRDNCEDAIATAAGHKVFLSGGSCCRNGVGICVSRRLLDQISGLTFFSISDRICCIHFKRGHSNFRACSYYMPTSWEPDDAAEHVYDLLGILLLNCDHAGAIPIIGGDFNAVIGNPLPGDDMDLLGTCGFGPRNDRGWMLERWVLEHDLFIQTRLDTNIRHDDSWTCQRSMDGMRVQMDYVLSCVQQTSVGQGQI